jgi:hypothetical protein
LKLRRSASSSPVMFKYPIIWATWVSLKAEGPIKDGKRFLQCDFVASAPQLDHHRPLVEHLVETGIQLIQQLHRDADDRSAQLLMNHFPIRVIRVIRGLIHLLPKCCSMDSFCSVRA